MSDKNETTITNALYAAADQYDRDAKLCTCSSSSEGCVRLSEQFERQATEARRLAAAIEAAGLDNVEYL